MKRSRWGCFSAVWNGSVFLCFCSGLPSSGEPQNDICKVELQFSLSHSIHTYIYICIYIYLYTYIPILWYAYRTLHPQKGRYKSFDGPSLELDLKKVTRFYGWKSHSYHLQGSNQTHPNSTPSHCISKLPCGRLQFLQHPFFFLPKNIPASLKTGWDTVISSQWMVTPSPPARRREVWILKQSWLMSFVGSYALRGPLEWSISMDSTWFSCLKRVAWCLSHLYMGEWLYI